MKTLFLGFSLILGILIISPIEQKTNDINFKKYFSLKYGSFERNGETINYVTPKIVEKNDSISKLIMLRERRIKYLLTNNINSDTLQELLPDSTKIKKVFTKQIENANFKTYVEKIIFPNKEKKEQFTEIEMMNIASKFFLVEKSGNRGLASRICSGINGQISNTKKDYTLLEVFAFDAIFDRMLQRNEPKVDFLENVNRYIKTSVTRNDRIKSLDSLETVVRKSVYTSMENDSDLKQTLLNYYDSNKENLPIIISSK